VEHCDFGQLPDCADHWPKLQAAYDLAQARRHADDIKAKRYEPQPAL
jgi:hypothetical protein